MKKMNSAYHRHALSGMAISTGIATGKNSVDGLCLRPIVELVKDRSADFLCFGAPWLLQSNDLARTATKTRVVPNGTRDERRGRAC